MIDIQKEWNLFVAHLRTLGVVKIGRNALGVITNLTREGNCSLGYNDIELMWETWQVKAQAVPEGFVLVPKEPTELFKEHLKNYLFDLWAGDHGCDWDGFVSVDAINHNTIWKMMIEAQEQSHD